MTTPKQEMSLEYVSDIVSNLYTKALPSVDDMRQCQGTINDMIRKLQRQQKELWAVFNRASTYESIKQIVDAFNAQNTGGPNIPVELIAKLKFTATGDYQTDDEGGCNFYAQVSCIEIEIDEEVGDMIASTMEIDNGDDNDSENSSFEDLVEDLTTTIGEWMRDAAEEWAELGVADASDYYNDTTITIDVQMLKKLAESTEQVMMTQIDDCFIVD